MAYGTDELVSGLKANGSPTWLVRRIDAFNGRMGIREYLGSIVFDIEEEVGEARDSPLGFRDMEQVNGLESTLKYLTALLV